MNIEKKDWLRHYWPVLHVVANSFDMPPYMIYDMWEDINYQNSNPTVYAVKRLMREYKRQTPRRQDQELMRCSLMGAPVWNNEDYSAFLYEKEQLKQIDALLEGRNIIR